MRMKRDFSYHGINFHICRNRNFWDPKWYAKWKLLCQMEDGTWYERGLYDTKEEMMQDIKRDFRG